MPARTRRDGLLSFATVTRLANRLDNQARERRRRQKREERVSISLFRYFHDRYSANVQPERIEVDDAVEFQQNPAADWDLPDAPDHEYEDDDENGNTFLEDELDEFVPRPSRTGEAEARRLNLQTAITLVIPKLGEIYATNKMRNCFCGDHRKSKRKIVCVELTGLSSFFGLVVVADTSRLDIRVLEVDVCGCSDWSGRLILQGYFPTIPNAHTAISLDVLELFQAVSTHGSFSKHGFAKGLEEFHRFKRRRELPNRYEKMFRIGIQFWIRTRLARDDYIHNTINGFLRRQEGGGEKELDGKSPTVLGVGNLQSQCPACFYRVSLDDVSPAIISIDGNMQHSRRKHVSPQSAPYLDPKLFDVFPLDPSFQLEQQTAREGGTVCDHNFSAISKPHSMRFCDETGLLLVVCRHDIPLRFVNLYAGERLGWIEFTIERLIEAMETQVQGDPKIEVILLYDIACQLEPYLRKRDRGLATRVRLAVNKFHGYAHEYRCQELWGAAQCKGLGESDGEGTERIWALLRVLVSSGRLSSSANRMLFLENLALAISSRKRRSLGTSLRLRYVRYASQLEEFTRKLDAILGQKLSMRPETPEVEITEEFLREEHRKQREYFATPTPLVSQPHLAIFHMIKEVKQIEDACKLADELVEEGRLTGIADDVLLQRRDAAYIRAKHPELAGVRVKLAEALYKANQTEYEWREGGDRWRLAERVSGPDRDIYALRVKEEKCLIAHRQAVLNKKSDEDVRRLLEKYEVARAAVDTKLAETNGVRADWEVNEVCWVRAANFQVIAQLELIYSRLLRAAASRASEFRHLKGRVMGGKESERMLKKLMSRYPKMEKDIRTFNELAQKLDQRFRPPPLTLAAFREATSMDQGTEASARDALFSLHLCRSALIDPEPNSPQQYWSQFPVVRSAIHYLLRKDRGREELELLKTEWQRICTYTRELLISLWEFTVQPSVESTQQEADIVKNVYPIIWIEIIGANNLVYAASKSKGIFSSEDLQDLITSLEAHLEKHYRNQPNATEQEMEIKRQEEEAMQDAFNDPIREGSIGVGPFPDEFKQEHDPDSDHDDIDKTALNDSGAEVPPGVLATSMAIVETAQTVLAGAEADLDDETLQISIGMEEVLLL